MSRIGDQDRGSEQPRVPPEIIPAGCEPRPTRGPVGLWMRIDQSGDVHRVFIVRPSPPAIILGLLVLGLVAAVLFLVLAGIVLLWIPLLIGGILLTLLSGSIRHFWRYR